MYIVHNNSQKFHVAQYFIEIMKYLNSFKCLVIKNIMLVVFINFIGSKLKKKLCMGAKKHNYLI